MWLSVKGFGNRTWKGPRRSKPRSTGAQRCPWWLPPEGQTTPGPGNLRRNAFFGSGRRSSKQHAAFPAAQPPGAAELHRRRCGTARGRLRGAGALSPRSLPLRLGQRPAEQWGPRQRMQKERSDSARTRSGAAQQQSRRTPGDAFPNGFHPAVRRGHGIGSPSEPPATGTPPEELGFFLSGSRKRLLPVPVPLPVPLPVPPLTLGSGERGGGPAPPGPSRPAMRSPGRGASAEPAPELRGPSGGLSPATTGRGRSPGLGPTPPQHTHTAPFPFPSP